ncbi:MAG: hypothetical protein DRO67_00700 [Candidatus Asgardarchaeum californiense]|nr:MAG: hypothetical protein DRO67_00700 [Candidatus Asgardarchaeum californiense]
MIDQEYYYISEKIFERYWGKCCESPINNLSIDLAMGLKEKYIIFERCYDEKEYESVCRLVIDTIAGFFKNKQHNHKIRQYYFMEHC